MTSIPSKAIFITSVMFIFLLLDYAAVDSFGQKPLPTRDEILGIVRERTKSVVDFEVKWETTSHMREGFSSTLPDAEAYQAHGSNPSTRTSFRTFGRLVRHGGIERMDSQGETWSFPRSKKIDYLEVRLHDGESELFYSGLPFPEAGSTGNSGRIGPIANESASHFFTHSIEGTCLTLGFVSPLSGPGGENFVPLRWETVGETESSVLIVGHADSRPPEMGPRMEIALDSERAYLPVNLRILGPQNQPTYEADVDYDHKSPMTWTPRSASVKIGTLPDQVDLDYKIKVSSVRLGNEVAEDAGAFIFPLGSTVQDLHAEGEPEIFIDSIERMNLWMDLRSPHRK